MELANVIALLAPRTALICIHRTNNVSPNAPYTARFAKWNNLQHFVAILNIHICTMYGKCHCVRELYLNVEVSLFSKVL